MDVRRALVALTTAGLLAGCSGSSVRFDPPAAAATIPATGYTALGDSYSSGEGAAQYLPGSDVAGDQCHRSVLAYPSLLDSSKQLGTLTFASCAGAVTSDLVGPNHEKNLDPTNHAIEPAQISVIPVHAKTVTLTIGGNDAGFASVLESCVSAKVGPIKVFPHFFESFGGCHGNATLNKTVATRLRALAGTATAKTPDGTPIVAISDLLSRIHQRAPQAHVYVVGYPVLFGSTARSCHVGDVKVLHVPWVGDVKARLTVSAADTRWLNEVAIRLNDVLRQAANSNSAATSIDASAYFAGHRLCDSETSWIAPVTGHADLGARTSGLNPGSIHPTPAGQRGGYAAALLAAGVS